MLYGTIQKPNNKKKKCKIHINKQTEFTWINQVEIDEVRNSSIKLLEYSIWRFYLLCAAMLCHKVSRLQGSVCALPQSTARVALLLCTAFLPIWNSDKIFLLYHKTTSTSQNNSPLPPFPHQRNSPPSPNPGKRNRNKRKLFNSCSLGHLELRSSINKRAPPSISPTKHWTWRK